MPWLYILHLDHPHHHARHYSGCTPDLRRRLTDHACGRGSVLTRYLFDHGIDWTIGAVFQVAEDLITLRQAERLLKDQHHAPRYCRICSGQWTKSIPGAQEVPLAYAPYATDSRTLRATAEDPGTIHSPTNDTED